MRDRHVKLFGVQKRSFDCHSALGCQECHSDPTRVIGPNHDWVSKRLAGSRASDHRAPAPHKERRSASKSDPVADGSIISRHGVSPENSIQHFATFLTSRLLFLKSILVPDLNLISHGATRATEGHFRRSYDW
jgi:hypothetical protein